MSHAVRLAVTVWNRIVVVPLLLVRGERAMRGHRAAVARARFMAAVARAPSCFRAHFGLARAHAAAGRDAAARRELVIARHLAPSRFRELRRTLPAPYRDAELMLSSSPVRHVVARPAPRAASAVPERAARTDRGTFERTVRDDCRGAAERARFRAMGAIRDEEARDVDWDRLSARLGRADV